MRVLRKTGLAVVLLLTLLWLGCGDVFRPVATPILKPGGDPSAFRFLLTVNNNNGGIGSNSEIDVSGDTNLANYPVGRGPIHAAFPPGQTQVFIANEAGDTLSFYSPLRCVSGCTGTPAGTPANTIALPAGSRPVFVAVAPSGKAYVANAGTNSVSVVSTVGAVQLANVPVGPNPAALVLSSDMSKLYCINKGNGATNGTVTILATADNTFLGELVVGRSPVGAALSPDGSTLYVLNQGSGTVSVINTVVDSLVGTPVPVGSVPTQLFVDSHLNRLYVSNSGSNTISAFNISANLPNFLKTVVVGTTPVSLTVLGDGSRIYVANAGSDNVTVISASSLAVKGTPIPVGINPVYIATSQGDTSRVFVANYGPPDDPTYGFISDIDTSTDTVVGAPDTNVPPGTPPRPPLVTLPSGSPRPVFLLPSS